MHRYIRPLLIVVALLAAAQASTSTVTVRRGDTLTSIAKQARVPVSDLARANGLRDSNRIRVGQVLRVPGADASSASPFAGLGTWVDVYDFSPEFQTRNAAPVVTPTIVDRMAAAGVRTLYLQAAVSSGRAGVIDAPIVGGFLNRAHGRGMRVVAWYLPTLRSVDTDLRKFTALRDFRANGQRFDGLGVDIESTSLTPKARSDAVVQLSKRLRASTRLPLGAIVMPPGFLDVVSPNFWPGFPWSALKPSYDAWLPMAYWTLRTSTSGYRDAARYTSDTVTRLRARLGGRAAIHPIGGLGTTDAASYAAFVGAAKRAGVAGWSVYDFATTPSAAWRVLRG